MYQRRLGTNVGKVEKRGAFFEGIHGAYSRQIQSTLDFNKDLKALGVYQTGADAYAFSGANKWNHADTDAFGHLPFWPRMTVGRMYVYDSTMNRCGKRPVLSHLYIMKTTILPR